MEVIGNLSSRKTLLQFPLQDEWGWGSLIIHQAENTLIGHVMIKIVPDVTGLPTDDYLEDFMRFLDKYVSHAVGNHHFLQWSKSNRTKTFRN